MYGRTSRRIIKSEVLERRLESRKYAEIKTRSNKTSASAKFVHFFVYGCILDVITSISSATVVEANCK